MGVRHRHQHGWGSLVVTSSTYLAQAGPWGSAFGMVLFVSLIYLSQSIMSAVSACMDSVERYYVATGVTATQAGLIDGDLGIIRRANALSVTAVLVLIGISMGILIGTFRKISLRAQSSEMQLSLVREMANRDALTGVKSRHAYAEKEKALDEAIANGSIEAFALVICDLNGLKFINDEYGHKAGDERIKQASKMICDFFAHSPVFRNGGDEFVVYLTGRDYEERHEIHAAMYKEKMLLKSLGAKTR